MSENDSSIYFCGIEFSPVYFAIVANEPDDKWALKLVELLFEKTGRRFNIIPLARYIFSMNFHNTMKDATTTNRVPILVGCTIPSLFPSPLQRFFFLEMKYLIE